MLLAVLQLLLGLALLLGGGHYLVRGATRIAILARVSTAVVGLTVVAMGTSLPELAVSMRAAAHGSTDLAYGNIIGSTIFNIGMILGVSAVIAPMVVKLQTLRLEYPFMFSVACVVLLLCRDAQIDRLEGAFLVILLVLFTVYVVYLAQREVDESEAAALDREVRRTANIKGSERRAWGVYALLVVVGIAALVGGADQIVRGAIKIAEIWGVPERIIGLTVVAMGTSLPELATSAVAAREGEHEIALANVIGSNLFNLLGVLGATAVIFPVPIHPAAASIDNWVMLGFCAAMFPLMWFGRRVGRFDGVILLAGFAAYMIFLVVSRGL
ncbi:MAG: calcium/sodium antiporter [Gemmatimonadota bacterium]|nr:MAG: calcium/sodium antiporter [Gemmatimonadota bacterium]